jgi:2-polyprenyl-3-methyl-5-hydroxy-6-metoxy-1,4-benzoquinol methylase
MLNYALDKSNNFPDITYRVSDILSDQFKKTKFDVVSLNAVCHHLDNKTLVSLLKQLSQQTRLAIIINDLHRHWLP